MIRFMCLPTDSALRITSEFGLRQTGINGATTDHKGIDLGRDWTKPYTNIINVRYGKVIENGWNPYRGWYVTIEHGMWKTRYQHLRDKCKIQIGSYIRSGTVLGVMGKSADPSVLNVAVHLHFELIINGVYTDPKPYLLEVSGGTYMELENAIKILKEKANLNDDTIKYLLFYIYGKELIIKLASVM